MRENRPCSSTHPDAVKTASLPRATPYLIRQSRIVQPETTLGESLDQFCRSYTVGGNSCQDTEGNSSMGLSNHLPQSERFIWFIWFIWLVWFNQTNETNQKDEIDQMNQAPSSARVWPLRRGRL